MGTVTASHKMLTLQALSSSLNAGRHCKEGLRGPRRGFWVPSGSLSPKRHVYLHIIEWKSLQSGHLSTKIGILKFKTINTGTSIFKPALPGGLGEVCFEQHLPMKRVCTKPCSETHAAALMIRDLLVTLWKISKSVFRGGCKRSFGFR